MNEQMSTATNHRTSIHLENWKLMEIVVRQIFLGGAALICIQRGHPDWALLLILAGIWQISGATRNAFLAASVQGGVSCAVAIFPLVEGFFRSGCASLGFEGSVFRLASTDVLITAAASLAAITILWKRRKMVPDDVFTGAFGEFILIGIPVGLFAWPVLSSLAMQRHLSQIFRMNAWDLNHTLRWGENLTMAWEFGIGALVLIGGLVLVTAIGSLRAAKPFERPSIDGERYVHVACAVGLPLMILVIVRMEIVDEAFKLGLFRVPALSLPIDRPLPMPMLTTQWLICSLLPAIPCFLGFVLLARLRTLSRPASDSREQLYREMAPSYGAFCFLHAGVISTILGGALVALGSVRRTGIFACRMFDGLIFLALGIMMVIMAFWLARNSTFKLWSFQKKYEEIALAGGDSELATTSSISLTQTAWSLLVSSIGFSLFLGPVATTTWFAGTLQDLVSTTVPAACYGSAAAMELFAFWGANFFPVALFLLAVPAYLLVTILAFHVRLLKMRQEPAAKEAPTPTVAGV